MIVNGAEAMTGIFSVQRTSCITMCIKCGMDREYFKKIFFYAVFVETMVTGDNYINLPDNSLMNNM